MSMILEFEDHGQDFLTWTLDENDMVCECKPFQGSIWCGSEVLNADELQQGLETMVEIKKGNDYFTVKYPVASISYTSN